MWWGVVIRIGPGVDVAGVGEGLGIPIGEIMLDVQVGLGEGVPGVPGPRVCRILVRMRQLLLWWVKLPLAY